MPRGSKNSTYHLIEKPLEFWQYKFSPTVILTEKRLRYYDEERFKELEDELKTQEKVIFNWAVASENTNYVKQNCRVELYKKYQENVSFQDKVKDMKRIVEKYGL